MIEDALTLLRPETHVAFEKFIEEKKAKLESEISGVTAGAPLPEPTISLPQGEVGHRRSVTVDVK